MEIEAVAEIAAMFGLTEFLGHLTSSGTLANLEALWIAGQVAAGETNCGFGAGALHPPKDFWGLKTRLLGSYQPTIADA